MKRQHIAGIVVVLALAVFAPLVATRAQESPTGTAALAGKDVNLLVTGGEFKVHVDAAEAAGLWVTKLEIVHAAQHAELPGDVNEYRYFWPWSSIQAVKVKM
jgi:hypothetical protein